MGCAWARQADAVQRLHAPVSGPAATTQEHASQASPVGSIDVHAIYGFGRVLGAGAFGTVFHATRDLETFAVKVVSLVDCNAPRHSDCKERFHTERATWSAAGRHPNVVALQEWHVEGDFGYFVMELCEGSLFQAWRREENLSERTYAPFFSDMAVGLQYIHSLGIVHRDIKHDNFLLGGPTSCTAKLCDFGFACMVQDKITLAQPAGTTPFMAPEALNSSPACGTAADVWSFGVIVYVAFFGRWPYNSMEFTQRTMSKAIRSGAVLPQFKPPPTLEQHLVSDVAVAFVRPLLVRDPKARPSAAECLKMDYLATPHDHAPSDDPHAAPPVCLKPLLKAANKAGIFAKYDPQRRPRTLELMTEKQNLASTRRAAKSSSNQSSCESRPSGSTGGENSFADLFAIPEDTELELHP